MNVCRESEARRRVVCKHDKSWRSLASYEYVEIDHYTSLELCSRIRSVMICLCKV